MTETTAALVSAFVICAEIVVSVHPPRLLCASVSPCLCVKAVATELRYLAQLDTGFKNVRSATMSEMRLPSISSTESLLLDLLEHRERFGLELVDASGGKVKRGSVYVTLARMEAKGFESRQEDRPPGAIGLPVGSTAPPVRAEAYATRIPLLREALALKPAEAQ